MLLIASGLLCKVCSAHFCQTIGDNYIMYSSKVGVCVYASQVS